MFMKIQIKPLAVSLAVPLVLGAVSGFMARDGMAAFTALQKPPLTPPGWVFPVVWTILYAMMGYASYLVYTSGESIGAVRVALAAYGVSLAVNLLWPQFFFGQGAYMAAFLLLCALLVLVLWTARLFGALVPTAGALLVPYLLWIVYAGYLNLGVARLN